MRTLAIVLLLGCAACADKHALPETSSNDPMWQLNVGKWLLGVNDLKTPPPDAGRGPAVAASTGWAVTQ
jgi:hypothetical protein